MAENTKRSVFGFHGIFGVLISIFGLIFIWAVLMSQAIVVQQKSAHNPYDHAPVRDIHNVKMISVENKKFSITERTKND